MKMGRSTCTAALLALVAAAPAWAVPVNDDCPNRVILPAGGVAEGSVVGTTVDAVEDGVPVCGLSGVGFRKIDPQYDVWYLYTATINGFASVSTSGDNCINFPQGFNIALWSGCPTSGGSEITCTTNACFTPLNFAVTSGQSYLLRVASCKRGTTSIQQGEFNLIIDQLTPPTNDDCGTALATGPVASLAYNPTLATNDGRTISCSGDSGHNDVWFNYTAASSGVAHVGTDGDSSVAFTVYNSCAGSELACNSVSADFAIVSGQHYLIRVAVLSGGDVGARHLSITESAAITGDDCSSPVVVVGPGNYLWDDAGATRSGPFPTCGLASSIAQRDIWFQYTATATGTTAISVGQSFTPTQNVNTTLAVFNGCAGSAIACGARSNADRWWVCFGAVAGQQYMIRLASPTSSPAFSNSSITIQENPTANNGACTSAQTLVAGAPAIAWNNTGACENDPFDTALNCNGVAVNAGLWYKFTPGISGVALLSTGAGDPDTILQAFSGTCGGTTIECSAGTSSHQFSFPVTSGVPVFVRLSQAIYDGNSNFYRSGTLSLAVQAKQAGDDCSTAVGIAPGTTMFNNLLGTDSAVADPDCSSAGRNRHDMWFSWTPAKSGSAVISTCGQNGSAGSLYDTVLAVYQGCNGTQLVCNNDAPAEGAVSDLPVGVSICGEFQSFLGLNVTAGTTYIIRVGSSSLFGSGRLNLDFQAHENHLLTSAEVQYGTGTLSSITGSFNGPLDVHIYKIKICDINTFMASTDDFATTNVNTVLSLFDKTGHGVAFHDDVTLFDNGRSTITSQYVNNADTYFLAISPGGNSDQNGRRAISGGGLIWYEQPIEVERAPDGPGSIGAAAQTALSGWLDFGVIINPSTNTFKINLIGACKIPGCPADFDGSGVRDVSDIFAFLRAWFAKAINADFDHNNVINVSDIFAFLRAWFAGC